MNDGSSRDDDAGFLECLYKDPDSNSSEQRYGRLHQWRPISWNPFDVNDEDEMTREGEEHRHLLEKSPTSPEGDFPTVAIAPPKREPNQLLNPGPAWVNLFYDLAWTATFSSLTQNGQFDTIWVLYSINFYTDDWFHLLSIFLQVGIFGSLAATTRGYDITTYILRSPGLEPGILEPPKTLREIDDPKRYNDELTARTSIRVIACSIALSRVILLVQHLRVLAYAHLTVRSHRGRGYHIPQKLHIIPIGLFISTALFFTAWGITNSEFGAEVLGAKLKYVLWGLGLIVEVFSHIRMSRISWSRPRFSREDIWYWNIEGENKQETPNHAPATASRSVTIPPPPELPVPHSDVTLSSRLEAITTIILGEGINGIAGTLYSILSAPGLENPIVTNIICSGLIVYLLAYLYFEGPSSGHMDLKEKGRRKVYWLLLHLPFLLCVVLLLQGVKNQFLLTSFLSTARGMAKGLDDVDDDLLQIWTQPNLASNATLIDKLKHYNISWTEEHKKLVQTMTGGLNLLQANASAPLSDKQKGILYIWHWRLTLQALVEIHKLFMGDNSVSPGTRTRIYDYLHNVTEPQHDHETTSRSEFFGDLNYYQILEDVLGHSVQSARYIMVFAGLVFILLGALDLAHSRPRDRFQCGAIISRFLMGWAFLFLLLLNIGGYQKLWVSKGHEHEQAGVFLWISSYWVIPTIALAFGVEFLVETASPIRYRPATKSNTPSRLSYGWQRWSGSAARLVPTGLSLEWHGAR
ncbi:unnamed protein product [Rhizoctonia solani]|uniref:Transmembrane protein n=1 Tax=Rhizoctonia solani TaxID=456999 RepID=A0A8H3CUP0_9AGAM|nr:unnamed protein product [Rhizoctonia solani]